MDQRLFLCVSFTESSANSAGADAPFLGYFVLSLLRFAPSLALSVPQKIYSLFRSFSIFLGLTSLTNKQKSIKICLLLRCLQMFQTDFKFIDCACFICYNDVVAAMLITGAAVYESPIRSRTTRFFNR